MNKTIVFICIIIGLFLVACSSNEKAVLNDPDVKLFLAMSDDVTQSTTSFSGDAAKAVSDLAKTDCQNGLGEEFTRSEFASKAYTLAVYSDDGNISCKVLKANKVSGIVQKTVADAPSNGTLIVINSKPLMREDLQRSIDSLPKGTVVNETVVLAILDRMVDDELLRQEQEKIEVTSEDIAKVRSAVLKQAGVDESGLEAALSKQGITTSQFDEMVKSQAKMDKLFSERLLVDNINISDDLVKEYYLQNPNQFMITEQAKMRHIFVNGTGSASESKVNEISSKLDTVDFCELVKKYSDDVDSKQSCGEYAIPRGVIDPMLERAAFTTPQGKTAVVKTAQGTHFVQTVQVTQAQMMPYSVIGPKMQDDVRNQIFRQRLSIYLTTLRANAQITTYLG